MKVLDGEATVTCLAHGGVFRLTDGVFRLTDGAVVRAPAPRPVPAFETRVRDGAIELRPRA